MNESSSLKRKRERDEIKYIVAHVIKDKNMHIYPRPGSIVESGDRKYEIKPNGQVIRINC